MLYKRGEFCLQERRILLRLMISRGDSEGDRETESWGEPERGRGGREIERRGEGERANSLDGRSPTYFRSPPTTCYFGCTISTELLPKLQ